jgi:AcrR family transcriptional regulator
MTVDPAEVPERRTSAKGVRRRLQILDRAIELFAERGVDGASLRSLADEIGVSHTALRHYFDSRDELLIEVYREHESRSEEAAVRAAGGAVAEMSATADRNRSVPGLVQLYATLTTDALQEQHPVTREFVRNRFAELRGVLTARIERAQEAGEVASDIGASDAAALLIAASDGLQVQWLLDPGTVDVRRSLDLLRRLLPDDGVASVEG